MGRHMEGYSLEVNILAGTMEPICLIAICCRGSCQEHCGIMFSSAVKITDSHVLKQKERKFDKNSLFHENILMYSL